MPSLYLYLLTTLNEPYTERKSINLLNKMGEKMMSSENGVRNIFIADDDYTIYTHIR